MSAGSTGPAIPPISSSTIAACSRAHWCGPCNVSVRTGNSARELEKISSIHIHCRNAPEDIFYSSIDAYAARHYTDQRMNMYRITISRIKAAAIIRGSNTRVIGVSVSTLSGGRQPILSSSS